MGRMTFYDNMEKCWRVVDDAEVRDGLPTKGEYVEQSVIDRLAAYEDTGLEPEEVLRQNEKLLCMDFHQAIKTDRLVEIVKAKREGRLVVLPCKVGDTLYHTGRGSVEESRVAQINLELCMDNGEGISGIWWTHNYNIGKTVFRSREEAEAALGGANL